VHAKDKKYSFVDSPGDWDTRNTAGCDRHHCFFAKEKAMKIVLDRPRCEGHGLCEEVAPQLMHLDGEGELVLDIESVDGALLDPAKAAVRVCPVAALQLA
jgi:ferredoxin